jgi:hypothetical protein
VAEPRSKLTYHELTITNYRYSHQMDYSISKRVLKNLFMLTTIFLTDKFYNLFFHTFYFFFLSGWNLKLHDDIKG